MTRWQMKRVIGTITGGHLDFESHAVRFDFFICDSASTNRCPQNEGAVFGSKKKKDLVMEDPSSMAP